MNTDQLIQSLARDVKPVRRHVVAGRIALGIAGGGLVALLLVSSLLGFRADLHLAVRSFGFWMKWIYTISLAVCAVFAVASLARPTGLTLGWLWLIPIPIALLAGIGIGELAHTPSTEWLAMWLGQSWRACPWIVLGLAAPIFLGLLWSFRPLAPTRLRAAGAAAGLSAGAAAASIYCLHCPEVSAIFVLTWYSLGIALSALIGALAGPRLLRW